MEDGQLLPRRSRQRPAFFRRVAPKSVALVGLPSRGLATLAWRYNVTYIVLERDSTPLPYFSRHPTSLRPSPVPLEPKTSTNRTATAMGGAHNPNDFGHVPSLLSHISHLNRFLYSRAGTSATALPRGERTRWALRTCCEARMAEARARASC